METSDFEEKYRHHTESLITGSSLAFKGARFDVRTCNVTTS